MLGAAGARAAGWWRALLGLLGVGLVLVGLLRRAPSAALVRQQVLDISLLDTVVLRRRSGRGRTPAPGLLVLAGGVLTCSRSGRWPGRTDRFRRDAAPVDDRSAPTTRAGLWKAMDAGLDPTTDHPDRLTRKARRRDRSTPADPDVRKATLTRHNGYRPTRSQRAQSRGGSEEAMASTDQQANEDGRVTSRPDRSKHVHHGRTAAAWAGTSIAMVAFLLGGIAVVIQNWMMFWIAVALLVVSLIATKVLQVMGHGAR